MFLVDFCMVHNGGKYTIVPWILCRIFVVLSFKSSFLFVVGPGVKVSRVHMTTAYEYDLNQTAEGKSCNFQTFKIQVVSRVVCHLKNSNILIPDIYTFPETDILAPRNSPSILLAQECHPW